MTQITPDDVWNYALPAYDPKTGRYKDQSIGDTPKIYTIDVDGKPTQGRRRAAARTAASTSSTPRPAKLLAHTPIYTGPPVRPPPNVDPRTLALPSAIGGLQTGCATDGKAIYTNGIDILGLGADPEPHSRRRAAASSRSAWTRRTENWRHERPKVTAVGGTKEKPAFTDVGDPVASGIAVANGVAYFTTTVSNKLVALDTATGAVLKEIDLGPVWCGPSCRAAGSTSAPATCCSRRATRARRTSPRARRARSTRFGLPGEDEVDRLKSGK